MVSGQKHRQYTDTNSIQEDSVVFKTHPTTSNHPNKSQNKSIHDCSQRTCVHTWEYRRKPRVYAIVKQKIAYKKEKRVK